MSSVPPAAPATVTTVIGSQLLVTIDIYLQPRNKFYPSTVPEKFYLLLLRPKCTKFKNLPRGELLVVSMLIDPTTLLKSTICHSKIYNILAERNPLGCPLAVDFSVATILSLDPTTAAAERLEITISRLRCSAAHRRCLSGLVSPIEIWYLYHRR